VDSIKVAKNKDAVRSRNAQNLRPFNTDNAYSSYMAMKAKMKAAGTKLGDKRLIEPMKGKKVFPNGRPPYLPLITV